MTVRVISSFDENVENLFADAKVLAIDLEGVDLGRNGKVSLIQIADGKNCIVVDVLNKDGSDPLVNWLRRILESPDVVKIIHDLKMDYDALYHLLNIRLTNIHDTAIWHSMITVHENAPLNDVLSYNGVGVNATRDKSVYHSNHKFWATRPLTEDMISWASGDVAKLIDVYNRQIKRQLSVKSIADQKATELADFFAKCKLGTVQVYDKGRFIGRGGANLRNLQRTTETYVYQQGNRSGSTFLVYYMDASSLEKVRKKAESIRSSYFDDDYY
jgi:exonuclease 3'-5' domain-containing protein 1